MKINYEQKILEGFLYNSKLKFNEIEKQLKIRSNKLNYHLQNLVKKGILTKEKEFYQLSETSENLIPYLSEKKHILPVILIHIGDSKKAFLITRDKRPYKNKLSLPGGRIILGESFQEATKRIMSKFNIKARFKKINSISLEHLKKSNKIIASYLLIYIKAKTDKKQKIKFTNLEKNKEKIIKSDYKLIRNDLEKELKIKTMNSKV